ncbi:fasciclin domain-containing protein [Aegicerativicinus sediminis]
MKKLLFTFKIFILIVASSAITACSDDDDGPSNESMTIVDVALDTPQLSTLVAALQAADGNLVSVLSGNGPFTVLAPTNDAFNAFLSANGYASLDDVPTEALTQILLNHVISGTVRSGDLATLGAGYTTTLSTASPGNNNLSLYFNTNGGVTFNGGSDVITADVMASNGTIHIVDAVIGLPNMVTFATADPNFAVLVDALTRSDLNTDFVSILSNPNAEFTVFAPINTAFTDLLTELELTSLSDIDEPTLRSTLTYHVVADANVRSSSLTDNMTVTTLGGDITADVTGGATLTDANDRVSNIVAVDVQTSNGVIHAIDKVILPEL